MGIKVEFPTEPGHPPGMACGDSGMSRTPSSRGQNHDTRQSWARWGNGVTLTPLHRSGRWRGGILRWGLLIAVTCLTPAPVPVQSLPIPHAQADDVPTPNPKIQDEPSPLSAKQRQKLMQANLDKSKSDAAELAALAKELREELDKPNANALSPDNMNRIEKIEKLAKRIRDEMKGYLRASSRQRPGET
ncbi:MAG: hypothetical protein WAO35_16640 [Terriglobia bacterium]